MRPVRHVRRRLLSLFGSALIVAGLLPMAAGPVVAAGSVSLTAIGTAYSQNFDTLATTGTANTTLPTGWHLSESGTSSRNNASYAASTGSDNAGDVYSFGAMGVAERAFGTLLSGTLTPIIGASFTNDTGESMSSLAISYTGEHWRLGTADRGPDRLDFQISVDATSLTTGAWVDHNALDFSTPNATGAVGLRDGNAVGNRTSVASAVTGLAIAPGATFWIRWTDFNVSGADDGLGVDDFSITPGVADSPPTVQSTAPADGATEVATTADVVINFSEPVTAAAGWYSISCSASGAHTATETGGPQSYTLDPDADFSEGENCTVTVDASKVSDVDTDDPPDNMAANHVFSFTTTLPLTQISEVQGAGHISPLVGELVKVEGVVIAERGSNVWVQDPTPDDDVATSEGILVFSSAVANAVAVGDLVHVRGTVTEFRPGCTPSCAPTSSAFSNLTITELASPGVGVTIVGTAPLPAATIIGTGGRVPPTLVIEDDSATGNVETSNTFDPAEDGIDFYETLESMLVRVNDPVAVGRRNAFGEIVVLADNGAGASVRTARGGIIVRDVDPGTVGDYEMGDFNPERIMLDDLFFPTPMVDVADRFASATGVMTYDFANYKIAVTSILEAIDGGLEREITRAPRDQEIVVGTYNVENLDPGDGPAFARHADLIVNHLRSPDVLAIEEIQDNSGPTNDGVTDASVTWDMLIAAILAAGGPTYEYRQIDPLDNQDGGQPGGNIRVGFLFRTDRGVSFIDRPGGDSATPTTVVAHPSGPRLSFSPGRVDPADPAWVETRKSLAGEFRMHGRHVFVIALHMSSKGGDQPLFGRFQPPTRSSEVARHAQAQSVNDFVDQILAVDPHANVIVLGDVNDFDFSETVQILEGGVLTSLMDTLPLPERYSYVFEGNSQVLDQILLSGNLLRLPIDYDPVHVNAEFADQASDHDPQVVRLDLRGRPTPRR